MTDLTRAQWHWFKSSFSGDSNGGCLEVATNLPGVVGVRDSKNPDGPRLALSPAAFRVCLRALGR
jgi:hypothetical protein